MDNPVAFANIIINDLLNKKLPVKALPMQNKENKPVVMGKHNIFSHDCEI